MQLQSFLGEWRLERTIEDARSGTGGTFSGRARFTPAPQGLRYREEGSLRLGAAPPLAAARDYCWREDGDGICVHFADGRFFHRLRPGDAAPADEHDCPPDLYRVRYDFTAWPVWRAEWIVSGPRKDYRLESRYCPG